MQHFPEIFKSFVKNGHQEYSDAGANHGPFRVDGPLLEEDGLFEPSVEVHHHHVIHTVHAAMIMFRCHRVVIMCSHRVMVMCGHHVVVVYCRGFHYGVVVMRHLQVLSGSQRQ